jgi:hypothetical protein
VLFHGHGNPIRCWMSLKPGQSGNARLGASKEPASWFQCEPQKQSFEENPENSAQKHQRTDVADLSAAFGVSPPRERYFWAEGVCLSHHACLEVALCCVLRAVPDAPIPSNRLPVFHMPPQHSKRGTVFALEAARLDADARDTSRPRPLTCAEIRNAYSLFPRTEQPINAVRFFGESTAANQMHIVRQVTAPHACLFWAFNGHLRHNEVLTPFQAATTTLGPSTRWRRSAAEMAVGHRPWSNCRHH